MEQLDAYADEIHRLRAELAAVTKELQAADDELNDFAECIAINRMYERQIAELRGALHHISLASQNSMSSQRECGVIAREALASTAPKEMK